MSGVWFAVCIPTEKNERKLRHHDDKETKDIGSGDTRPPAYSEQFPNGDVTSGESQDNKRNETNNRAPHIIPPEDNKKERLHKTKSKEALEERTLEKRLHEALDLLAIDDAVWVLNKEETYYQVYFPCEGPGLRCDFVLQTLMSRGIGEKGRSTVGIVPCAVFFNDDGEQQFSDEGSLSDSDTASVASNPKTEKKPVKGFKAMQREFLKSVTARLTVAQVVESVRTDANLTFDFIMFVIVASMVAALGLMENSSVVIVAAMLISPIMGPILAFTFGAVVRDIPLVLQGIRTEIVGLSLCLLSGFLFGLICGNFADTWGPSKFPTDEMYNRGLERSLWVGALIALPSGAGVALSVLGGNTASLVGVAISASLLPPAVNCGLLWGLGTIKKIKSTYENETVVVPIYNVTVKRSLYMPDRPPHYFVSFDKDCAVLGIMSLMLTVVNIACIIVAALFILKIKEVAPNTSDAALSRFWKQDIKIARDYNRTLGNNEGEQLGKQFLKEWSNLNGIDPATMMSDTAEGKLTQFHTLMDIVEDAQADDVYLSITRHVPALRRCSQAVNLPVLSPPPPDDDREIPRVWDVEYGPQSRSRRSSYAPNSLYPNRQDRMKKRRRSKAPSISINPVVENDSLQPPQVSAIPRKSVVYRRSLVSADNPYSLWPSQVHPNMGSRFDVTPVDDILPPLPNVLNRPRRSRCYSTAIPNPETITTSF